MADVTPGIITFGLGGDHTSMIVGSFGLGPFEVTIVVPPKPTGGGGGAAIPDRTRDWDDAPRSIIVRVRYKNKTTEKIYLVSNKRAEFIIAVSNFLSKTRDKISVVVTNMKRKMINVFAKIKNNEDDQQ